MVKEIGSNKTEEASQQSISASSILEVNVAFAEVLWLMNRSEAHRHIPLSDIDWLVTPPVSLKQVRIFRDEKQAPIACMSWAFVSDEVDRRLKSGSKKLTPVEWRSGQRFWIIDLVTPYGDPVPIMEFIYTILPIGRAHPVLRFGGKDLASLIGKNRNEPIN